MASISSEDQRELNQIIMISQKVDFSTVGNASSVYDYMTKKMNFKSRFALLYLKRLKELSSEKVDRDRLNCICCGANPASVNNSFCTKCFETLRNMSSLKSTTKSVTKSVEKSVEKTVDSTKSVVVNEPVNATVKDKAKKSTDKIIKQEEKTNTSTTNSKRDTLYKSGWDEKKSLTYLMTVELIPLSEEEKNDTSATAPKSSTEITSFDDGPLYRRGLGQEITSFDDVEDRVSTGTKKKKKKSCLGTVIKFILILILIYFGLVTLNGVLGFIVKYNNGELQFGQTETKESRNVTKNTELSTETPSVNQQDINIPKPADENVSQESANGSNNDLPNNSVDFSVYDVTEEQILDQLEISIENGIKDETGEHIRILYGERNTYGEENRDSYIDIINASGYMKLAQVGFKNNEEGYVKNVAIVSNYPQFSIALFESLNPNMSDDEIDELYNDAFNSEGKLYFAQSGTLYYCVSFQPDNSEYYTVVTMDRKSVENNTGRSAK